ncbi:MAG TPA: hypothetical protein VF608_12035 [Thermoanaerobaculia bacterium]
MRKFILLSLLIVAFNAFGHAGEVHTYMGTVTAMHDDGSFTMKQNDGVTTHVTVSAKTTYLRADGRPATRGELTAGKRVVVTMSKDGKTATPIKLAASKRASSK